jgi:hypothetical protein
MNQKMIDDPSLENSLFDDQADELYEIISTLSRLYNLSYSETQSYLTGNHDNSVMNDIQQLIYQSRIRLRATAGFESSDEISTQHIFIDNFIRQTARTIGFFLGIHKNVKFDLHCPKGFVRVSSEALLSSIMTITAELGTTVPGQGNVVIKTRYFQDMQDGAEFADLSIHDDGVWIESDPISHEADNTSGLDTHTRHRFQSIENFLEENRIKLLVSSSPELGTNCTLRIPIADRSNNVLDDEAQSGAIPAIRRWSIQLLTADESFKSNILRGLDEVVDDISAFSCMNEFSKYNDEHGADIIIVDDQMFSDIKIEDLILPFYKKHGQLIVFTSAAPDPALIPSGVMVMLKSVNQGILKPTIAAVKLVRLSNI